MIPFRIDLEKRLTTPRWVRWGVPLSAVAVALLFGAVLIALAGASPLETYRAMLAGAFGTPTKWADGDFRAISETLLRATPLIFTGLAVAIAFRMLFWNIGAEGQLVMGAIAASWVALFLPDIAPWIPQTAWIYLPLMVIGAMVAGGLWALGPALLKSKLQVNEIITTLMLNYVAILWYQYLYTTAWKDPDGFGFPGSADFGGFATLPPILGRLHWGFILALISAAGLWLLMDKTRKGYEIRLIGENVRAARYGGVSINQNIVFVMLLSGGLAALAGFAEVAGVAHALDNGVDAGNGFTGIIIAWLAKLRPGLVVVVSVLLGALLVGGDQLQITLGLPAAVGPVLQGAILLAVLGGDIFTRYRLRIRSKRTAEPVEATS